MGITDVTKGVLIDGSPPSGNMTTFYTNDLWVHDQFMGAGTYFLIKSLEDNKWNVSYKDLIKRINQRLKRENFDQRFRLSGNEKLLNTQFLK